MHIPDNYLSPSSCLVMAAAAAPAVIYSATSVTKKILKEKITLIGIGAAFSFLGMMLNIPLPGGTTGHAVGGTLIALLAGPEAACISLTMALILQALLFGDGGILSIGANCLNMAVILPFTGYYTAKLISSMIKTPHGDMIGAAIGSYIGINAAALCAAIEFGIQPYLFHNPSGQALYCPYGLDVSIPMMMAGHLTLFGAAEAVFTSSMLAFIKKTSPEAISSESPKINYVPFAGIIALLIAIAPIGLLAEGTAWGEWSTEELAKKTGLSYTPEGMLNGFEWHAMIPDYSAGGLGDTAGYYLSAIIGAAVLIGLFKAISALIKPEIKF